jgi:hypothetical protein
VRKYLGHPYFGLETGDFNVAGSIHSNGFCSALPTVSREELVGVINYYFEQGFICYRKCN